MEPPAANGDIAETMGPEQGYGINFGYYGLQANLSPSLYERMLCNERAKELQEVWLFIQFCSIISALIWSERFNFNFAVSGKRVCVK